MSTEDYISLFAGFFIGQVPLLVIALIGLWFAIRRKTDLQRVATWAIWGFSLLAVYTLAGAILRTLLFSYRTNEIIQSGSEGAMTIARFNLLSLAAAPLFFAGIAILARAVFLDRSGSTVEAPSEQVVSSA